MGYLRNYLLIIFILLSIGFYSCTKNDNNKTIVSNKDNYTLEIKIKGAINKTFFLYRYYGDKTILIDTVIIDKTGSFKSILDSKYKPGLYKLELGKNNFFNIIINNEDIALKTFVVNAIDSMQIIRSEENKTLYKYYKLQKELNFKRNIIAPVVKNYPKSTDFYKISLKEFYQIQEKYRIEIEELLKLNPISYAAKYITFLGFNEIDPKLQQEEQIQKLIKKHLQNTNFCDSSLLNSNAIPQKLSSYLSLFHDPNKSQTQIEEIYKNAVDNILNESLCNDQVFEFTLNYLVDGFEQLKYEEVLAHLSQNYVSLISCVNEGLKHDLEDRISKYARLSIGNIAPNFEINSIENELVILNNINSKFTLIFFWASWCPHCTGILPKLKKLYSPDNTNEFEIIAISLDTNKEEWESFLSGENYTWINCTELKGWESNVAIDYNIYATPTMILLDHNKKIIAKPRNIFQLQDFIFNY